MRGTTKKLKVFFVDISGSINPKAVQKTAKRILRESIKDVYAVRTFVFSSTLRELSFEELKELSEGKSKVYAEMGRCGSESKLVFEKLSRLAFEIGNQTIEEAVIISDLILFNEGD